MKKFLIIFIAIMWILIIFMCIAFDNKTYTLTGGTLGEYGKKITLNKDTDTPVDKYIYKIPQGAYTVTTDNDKKTSFFIVKDDLNVNKDEKYPEELNYVHSYLLTKNEKIEITLKEDESIQIVGKDTIILTQK